MADIVASRGAASSAPTCRVN